MPSSGTSNFNRRGIMKKSILIILASIFLSYPMNLIGADFETPHEFKSGDTISAEMMNEIFDYIKNAQKMILPSDLVGTWSCNFHTNGTSCTNSNWTNGTDSLYTYGSGTITMSDDGDGTYSYTTQPTNFIRCNDTSAGLGKWNLKNNVLFIDISQAGTAVGDTTAIRLRKISKSNI